MTTRRMPQMPPYKLRRRARERAQFVAAARARAGQVGGAVHAPTVRAAGRPGLPCEVGGTGANVCQNIDALFALLGEAAR